VRDWLGEQSKAFRNAIKIVVIDPSAPYASGLRAALPDANIAVDRWHLGRAGQQMVTEVSATRHQDLLGRRGMVADSVWVNRRLLMTAAEHLSPTHSTRLSGMLDDHRSD
jgi:transposase